jgi:HSP20 family protein
MSSNGHTQLAERRTLFPELDEVRTDLRDMFRSVWDGQWPFTYRSPALRLMEQQPAIDMFERDGNIVIKAEMPGIDPAKIDVTVADGELRISGECREESEVKEDAYYRSERRYGRVFRSVTLPAGCDYDQAAATVKDGVLEVVVPRKETAKGKKIEVTGA